MTERSILNLPMLKASATAPGGGGHRRSVDAVSPAAAHEAPHPQCSGSTSAVQECLSVSAMQVTNGGGLPRPSTH